MALPKSLWIAHSYGALLWIYGCKTKNAWQHFSIVSTSWDKHTEEFLAFDSNGGPSNDSASGCFPDTTGNDSSGSVSVYAPPHTHLWGGYRCVTTVIEPVGPVWILFEWACGNLKRGMELISTRWVPVSSGLTGQGHQSSWSSLLSSGWRPSRGQCKTICRHPPEAAVTPFWVRDTV